MNITLKNQTAFPQTQAIPEPLEIHPSVDPELARGLIAAVEHIEVHPEEFDMGEGFNHGKGAGCVICHVERLSNWRRPIDHLMNNITPLPIGHYLRIYRQDYWWHGENVMQRFEHKNTEGRLARIEHFLRTGE